MVLFISNIYVILALIGVFLSFIFDISFISGSLFCITKQCLSSFMLFLVYLIDISGLSIKVEEGASVVESGVKRNVLIKSIGGTARGTKKKKDPPANSTMPEILDFIARNDNKYLIKSKEGRFLCAKPRDPGVVFCKNENDPNTLWTIEKRPTDSGVALKTKGGKCLRLTGKDERMKSKGFYLNIKKCARKTDHKWKIRKLEDPSDKTPKKSQEKDPKKNKSDKESSSSSEDAESEKLPKRPINPTIETPNPAAKEIEKQKEPEGFSDYEDLRFSIPPPSSNQGKGSSKTATKEPVLQLQPLQYSNKTPSKSPTTPPQWPKFSETESTKDSSEIFSPKIPNKIAQPSKHKASKKRPTKSKPFSVDMDLDESSDLKDLHPTLAGDKLSKLTLNYLKTGDSGETLKDLLKNAPPKEESCSKRSLYLPAINLSLEPFSLTKSKTHDPTPSPPPTKTPIPKAVSQPPNPLMTEDDCKKKHGKEYETKPEDKDFPIKNPPGKCEDVWLSADGLIDKLENAVARKLTGLTQFGICQ